MDHLHDTRFPLGPSQERLLAASMLGPGRTNIVAVVALPGPPSRAAILAGLRRFVEHQDALRYRFEPGPDGPTQRPVPLDPAFDVEHRLRTACASSDLWPAADGVLLDLEGHPLEPFAGRMFRAGLVITRDTALVVLRMAHVIADIWSAGIVRRELPAACRTDAELPPLAVSLGSYARQTRDAWDAGGRERFVRHWSRTLAGAVPVELPLLDRPFRSAPMAGGQWARGTVMSGERLRALAAEHRLPSSALAFATVYNAFHALTGQDDLVLKSVVADRVQPARMSTVGCLVNSIFLRARPAAAPVDTAVALGRGLLRGLMHQAVWWKEVFGEMPEATMLSSRLRPQVQLEYFPQSDSDEPRRPAAGGRPEVDPGELDFGVSTRLWLNDLEFRFSEGDAVECEIRYRSDLWSPEQIATIFDQLRHEAGRLGLSAQRPA